jgi:PAS domain S-box-containing protein
MLDDYRHLFESNPSPMLICAIGSLELLAVNDALLSVLGYGREDLVGKSLLTLHPGEDHQAVLETLQPVQSGQVRGFHRVLRGLRHLRKDGTTVEVEAAGQPTVFHGKQARLVLLSDVGVKRRAEDVSARYAALFDGARDIILFISADGRILDANPAAARAYGYWREELMRLRIADLRENATIPEIPRQMQRAEGEGILFETVHKRRDGTPFPVEVNSASMELNGERVLVSVIRDVSARQRLKEIQAQLEAGAADAETVRKLAAEINTLLYRER